jgi:hypothetical protein
MPRETAASAPATAGSPLCLPRLSGLSASVNKVCSLSASVNKVCGFKCLCKLRLHPATSQYVTYCDCIPIWVGCLVGTSYGPDREASLITQHHHRSITAVGYGPRSESGHPGRLRGSERSRRTWSTPPPLRGLRVIARAASESSAVIVI